MVEKKKLEKLKERKAQLEAQIRLTEAREKTAERKTDTRRKILIGSYYLDKAKKDNAVDEIAKIMDGYLTRDLDRKLFGLNPKKVKKEK